MTYSRNGIGYNSEDEANLAGEIPSTYLARPLDAGYIAEAVIDSEWLAAHDAEMRRGQTRVVTEFIDSGDFHGFTVAEALREVERRLALAEKGTEVEDDRCRECRSTGMHRFDCSLRALAEKGADRHESIDRDRIVEALTNHGHNFGCPVLYDQHPGRCTCWREHFPEENYLPEWEWDRTYPDEPARVWKCCGGPYDEAPGGHYVQCTRPEKGTDRG